MSRDALEHIHPFISQGDRKGSREAFLKNELSLTPI
jgi:hypothetical protein